MAKLFLCPYSTPIDEDILRTMNTCKAAVGGEIV